jgi:hypothetical protein
MPWLLLMVVSQRLPLQRAKARLGPHWANLWSRIRRWDSAAIAQSTMARSQLITAIPFSHAIAAKDRPALEHLLISGLPRGIIGPERQPRINHNGQVGVVRRADGNAGKVGVGTQRDLLNRQAPNLRELYHAGI